MGYDSKIHKKTNKDYEPIHILNYIFPIGNYAQFLLKSVKLFAKFTIETIINNFC